MLWIQNALFRIQLRLLNSSGSSQKFRIQPFEILKINQKEESTNCCHFKQTFYCSFFTIKTKKVKFWLFIRFFSLHFAWIRIRKKSFRIRIPNTGLKYRVKLRACGGNQLLLYMAIRKVKLIPKWTMFWDIPCSRKPAPSCADILWSAVLSCSARSPSPRTLASTTRGPATSPWWSRWAGGITGMFVWMEVIHSVLYHSIV